MSAEVSLEQAIQSLRAGDHETARTILRQLAHTESPSPDVWLWLAAASDDPEQKRTCLEQVLSLNPDDQRAQAALRALEKSTATVPQPTTTPAATASTTSITQPTASETPKLPPPRPLARPQFAVTGVRARRPIPWRFVALVVALVMLIPITLWILA
jgi:hypothetical protein